MERPKDLIILEGISCIAYNKDLTMCVLSKKDKNLYVYKISNLLNYSEWTLLHTLKSVSNHI